MTGNLGAIGRALAVAAALLGWGAGAAWLRGYLLQAPFHAYGMEWFLRLGPGETGFYLRYLVTGLGGLFLFVWGLAPYASGIRARAAAIVRREALVTGILVAAAATAAAAVGWGLLRDQVLTDDEYTYLFQARLLLSGHAALPAPLAGDFLTNVFVVVRDGRWFGQYPPGHPLALAPAVLLGAPRLLPVVLAAVNLALVMRIVRRLAGPGWGPAAGVLLLASPLFVLTGGTLLSHQTALAGLGLAVLATLRVEEDDSWRWGWAAGLGLGLLLVTRPYTAVTLGTFPAVTLVFLAVTRRRTRGLLGAMLTGALFVGFFLLYNHAVSGHALRTGYDAVRGSSMREFGFGEIIPGVLVHDLAQGLRNAFLLSVRFHFWALGWPLVTVPAVLALRREASDRRAWTAAVLAAGMILVGLGSYVAYWSIGVNDTGPVKTYELLLPVTVLVALGARAWTRRTKGPVPLLWCAGSILAAALLFWPPQAAHLRELSAAVAEPLQTVEHSVRTPAVVHVRTVQPPRPRSWVYGWPNPRPDQGDAVLYVRDLGPRNSELARVYQNRTAYRLTYRDGGFVVDPLPRREANRP